MRVLLLNLDSNLFELVSQKWQLFSFCPSYFYGFLILFKSKKSIPKISYVSFTFSGVALILEAAIECCWELTIIDEVIVRFLWVLFMHKLR